MALKSVNFLPLYNSFKNDLIENFYIPALSNCKEYKRVSAFFDSDILDLYSTGIENIVESNGHISFIFSSQISEEDFIQMQDGYKNRYEIEKKILSSLGDEFDSIQISNLAYLIEKGYVDIKIAFTKKGIFHDKFGLISDGYDVLYFRGSNNETIAAIQNNYESFETSTSWNGDKREKLKIDNAVKEFQDLWSGGNSDIIVMDIPEIVKNKIVSYNKGKLILSYIDKKNCFVFDIDNENTLIGENKLDNPEILLPPSMWYQGHIAFYVENKPSIDNLNYIFHSDTSYIKMKKLFLLSPIKE